MSLIAWYKLNGNTNDASGNGLDGTPSGVSWVAGLLGGAGRFSKDTPSKITLPASNLIFTSASPFSVSCLLRWSGINSTNGNHAVTLFRDGGGNPAFTLYVRTTGELRVIYYNASASSSAISGGTLTANVWYHAAWTYDGTTHRLYRNGEQVGSENNTFCGFGSSAALIGNYTPTDSTRWYNGDVQDVRFHQAALAAWQVAKLWNFGRGTAEMEPWQRLVRPTLKRTLLPVLIPSP